MKNDILNSSLQEVTTVGEFTHYKTEIDQEDLDWVLTILSSNLYSDAIGSLIREYSANAWDANVEAGNQDKPIEVGIKTNSDEGSFWYVTDFGLGLSPDRINNIYRKFGKSTKRNDNSAIGMMGLGKFSGLSYAEQVFITTRHEGIEYQYIMHKAESKPQIDLLTSYSSELASGTTIKVFIKDDSDRHIFINKSKQQLAYFENIYYNCSNNEISNDFKIIKGKTFTYSNLQDLYETRIKLGPINYPINWNAVGIISSEQFNYTGIALNFEIGELAITPNRESILYNKKTVENIQKKLELFYKEVAELHDKQNLEFTNLDKYLKAKREVCFEINDTRYPLISYMKLLTKVKPVLKDFPYNLVDRGCESLFINYEYYGDRMTSDNKSYFINKCYKTLYGQSTYPSYSHILLLDEKENPDKKQIAYICDKYNLQHSSVLIIKQKSATLYRKEGYQSYVSDYYSLLDLSNYPKSQWRTIITKYQELQRSQFTNYPNLIVYKNEIPTPEWLLAQKVNLPEKINYANLRKTQGKFIIKQIVNSSQWNTNATTDTKEIAINKLSTQYKYIVYGTDEDKEQLKALYTIAKPLDKHRVEFWIVAKTHHKYFKQLTNFISYTDFMKGDNKLFKYYVSMYSLYKIYNTSPLDFSNSLNLIKELNTEHYKILNSVHIKCMEFGNSDIMRYNDSQKILGSMEEVAKENNYWNFELKCLEYRFSKIHNLYTFINYLNVPSKLRKNYLDYNPDFILFAVETCKNRGIKLNIEWYKLN